MSQRIRVGNVYQHDEHGEVLTTHHDDTNHIWFRAVQGRDNGGVLGTSEQIYMEDYTEFLSKVSMLDYPDNWDEIRHAVFERDNYTCQGCGDEDPEELHCHHICPLGAGGSNAKSNLTTLCDECHGRVHGGVT